MRLWDAVNNERMDDVQFLLTQGARSDWNNPRAIVSVMCIVVLVEFCLCYFFYCWTLFITEMSYCSTHCSLSL